MKILKIIIVCSVAAVSVPFVSFAVPFPDTWRWPFSLDDFPAFSISPPFPASEAIEWRDTLSTPFPASEDYAQLDRGDRDRWHKEQAKRDEVARSAARERERATAETKRIEMEAKQAAGRNIKQIPPQKIPDIIPFSVLMGADNENAAAVQNLAHEGLVLLGRALYYKKIKNPDVYGEHILRAEIIPGGTKEYATEYAIRMFRNPIGSTYTPIPEPSLKKGERPHQLPSISPDMLTLLQSETTPRISFREKRGVVIRLPSGGGQVKDQNRLAQFWQSDVGGAGYVETGIGSRSLPILQPFGVSSDGSCFSFVLNFNTHTRRTWSGQRLAVQKISIGAFGSDTMFIACDTNHDTNFDTITFHEIRRDGIIPLPVSKAETLLDYGFDKGYFSDWHKNWAGVYRVRFTSDPEPPPPPYQGNRMTPRR